MTTKLAEIECPDGTLLVTQVGLGEGKVGVQLTIDKGFLSTERDWLQLEKREVLALARVLDRWGSGLHPPKKEPMRHFRVLGCPGGHEMKYLDWLPPTDWTDLCPLCLADGDHNKLQVVGTVVLPFLKAPDPEEGPEGPTPSPLPPGV